MQDSELEVIEISIRLNELKSKFDRIIRDGETYENVKTIYLQIRELECYQNALQWHPKEYSTFESRPPSEDASRFSGKDGGNYRHIREEPPLL